MIENENSGPGPAGQGRRGLLKYVAAGTAGLGAATVLPGSAEAATGDVMKAGFENLAGQMTVHRLTGHNSSDAGLLSTDATNWSTNFFRYQGFALAGLAAGTHVTKGVVGVGEEGVNGYSTSGTGVRGESERGDGVTAFSSEIGGRGAALLVSGNAVIRRDDLAITMPPTFGWYQAGDLLASFGSSWVCVATGTSGTWRKLAGPDSAGTFHHRVSTAPAFDGEVGTTARLITFSVPAGTTGVALMITAVDPGAAGNVTVWQGGTAPRPSFHFAAGATVSTACQVKISPNRRVSVVASTPTRVQLDLQGYYL